MRCLKQVLPFLAVIFSFLSTHNTLAGKWKTFADYAENMRNNNLPTVLVVGCAHSKSLSEYNNFLDYTASGIVVSPHDPQLFKLSPEEHKKKLLEGSTYAVPEGYDPGDHAHESEYCIDVKNAWGVDQEIADFTGFDGVAFSAANEGKLDVVVLELFTKNNIQKLSTLSNAARLLKKPGGVLIIDGIDKYNLPKYSNSNIQNTSIECHGDGSAGGGLDTDAKSVVQTLNNDFQLALSWARSQRKTPEILSSNDYDKRFSYELDDLSLRILKRTFGDTHTLQYSTHFGTHPYNGRKNSYWLEARMVVDYQY